MNMQYMRDNLDDTYGILRLQDKILEIAVYIDSLCEKYDIDYCLMGGSALGAKRHGGFIPWDDDLDIFMKPSDYNKFKKIFNSIGDKDKFYLQELFSRNGMIASSKMRLNNSTYIEAPTKDCKIHQGIFVDIFILHNCPKSKIKQLIQCIAAKYILAIGQSYKNIQYTGMKKLAVNIIKMIPQDFGVFYAYKILYGYDDKKTPFVCDFMGKAFFRKGIYSESYFSEYTRVPFEKVTFNAPSNIHEYLTERFGDYMKLPPIDSIKQAQHAWKWDTERNFTEYVDNTSLNFSDETKLV